MIVSSSSSVLIYKEFRAKCEFSSHMYAVSIQITQETDITHKIIRLAPPSHATLNLTHFHKLKKKEGGYYINQSAIFVVYPQLQSGNTPHKSTNCVTLRTIIFLTESASTKKKICILKWMYFWQSLGEN